MKHPLICPNCGTFRYIEFIGVRFEEANKGFGVKLPFFKCRSCHQQEPIVPQQPCMDFMKQIIPSIKEGEFVSFPLKFIFSKLDVRRKFKQFRHLGLKYDPRDNYLIPGLYREWDDGYLTPVFFNKDILLYYNNHPDYSVKLYSFSSGNIYFKEKQLFNWGFGINRSGKIFKWLGDLDEDFKKKSRLPHLQRFQASNISSDHDIVSKFYFSQIPFSFAEAFQGSDNEYRLFGVKNAFDKKINTLTGVTLSKIDIENLSEYYKHPIVESKSQVFEAFLSLNKLIIENIQQDEIKGKLIENGISKGKLKGLGSLKLLGMFLEKILNRDDADVIMTPFYVLYDLRILHGHLINKGFQEKYLLCKERLSADPKITDLDFFRLVITRLIDFYSVFLTQSELEKI